MNNTRIMLPALLALWALFSVYPIAASSAVNFPPEFGIQSSENSYRARFVKVYRQDFEGSLSGVVFSGPEIALTTDPAEVIAGSRSLKMNGSSGDLTLLPSALALEPGRTYVIDVEFKVISAGNNAESFHVRVDWSGLPAQEDPVLGGPLLGVQSSGKYSAAIRLPTVNDASLHFDNLGSVVILDNIEVYRHDSVAVAPSPRLLKSGFPRLSNYTIFHPYEIADRYNVGLDRVESTLGRFDFVNGLVGEFTRGPAREGERLRAINPEILLIPYFESYVAQLSTPRSLGGAAGLVSLFNEGLAEDWFMHDPSGARIEEPRFPTNFQLNLTDFGGLVGGVSYRDYALRYISRSLLPSGLWDGVHFDEAVWYPNPLLSATDPFLGLPGPLPPIDLNNDGTAETMAELEWAWQAGFDAYFDGMRRQLGDGSILFGNDGEFPLNPSILGRFNGMQREFFTPFAIDSNGDWDTSAGTQWYALLSQLAAGQRYLRAPQLPSFQFTGFKLGTPSGGYTLNGVEDREPVLEPRDYRRMRLGLTTVLLGDAFFGYEYVDNTTLPIWFDEYAVDSSGRASTALSAKGYLGQPLGDAVELDYPKQVIASIDFEGPMNLPAGISVGSGLQWTVDPSQVIAGTGSGLLTITDPVHEDSLIFATRPGILDLDPGATYQLRFDYRILGKNSLSRDSFLVAAIGAPGATVTTPYDRNALFGPDIGQQGVLRVARKVIGQAQQAVATLAAPGTVAIDNIELIRGSGGVYRRDFENGIVLVNPTPESQTLSRAQIRGPLQRLGIKRIRGDQAPAWNDGSAVTAGLTLPPGDGIILLADRIAAPSPTTPGGVSATANATGDRIDIGWSGASGTVAGYLVRYGIAGGDATRFATLGRTARTLSLENLDPGTTYLVKVATYDYLGNLSAFSPEIFTTTPGSFAQRPQISAAPTLAPGAIISIPGTALASTTVAVDNPPFPHVAGGVRVLINGVEAPVIVASPSEILAVVPYQIEGPQAIIRVERDGVSSPTYLVPVHNALPYLWTWGATQYGVAYRPTDFSPVVAGAPAAAGETVNLVISGPGLLEPPAADGTLPGQQSKFSFTPIVQIGDGSIPVQVVDSGVFFGFFGFFDLSFVVPDGIPSGDQNVRVTIGGVQSNTVILPF